MGFVALASELPMSSMSMLEMDPADLGPSEGERGGVSAPEDSEVKLDWVFER